jgi:hypothetical protein
MRLPQRRTLIAGLTLAMAAFPAVVSPSDAAGSPPSKAQPAAAQSPAPPPAGIAAADRAAILGTGWPKSTDRAWRIEGDASGLHVLVAAASDGYTWRTAATLSEPGFSDDTWIGNACVTASGRRLAVAYAPRTFTNSAVLAARGAFTAVVDLETGRVAKLPLLSTLAYYSPGCGAGEAVVLTQAAGEHAVRTRLIQVDAATGKAARPIDLDGQVTSAVPVAPGVVVAADSARLVRVGADGRRTVVARTKAVPFKLVATAGGGVTFLDRDGDEGMVRLLSPAAVRGAAAAAISTVATGQLTALDLTRDASGRPYVTGEARPAAAGPGGVVLTGTPKGSVASTRGEALTWSERATRLHLRSRVTGKSASFTVDPGREVLDRGRTGRRARPTGTTRSGPVDKGAKTAAAGTLTAGSATNPVEAERSCAVPRNDPWNQVMQPKPRQVEWAVDQAVRNVLTVQREANWKNLGMPAYTPQGLFPPVPLSGGGYVPAQIVLGIAAQESNLWQATGRAMPGMTGNPLIGNFYGREIYDADPSNDWDIQWEDADCGYGIMQVTDGMRLAGHERPGETLLPYDKQRAVALDFAANVAAGLRILQQKWNETRAAGLVVNNGDPRYVENWFFAIWAYNSGFHADKGDGSPWGVGWLNNPANPHYPANRAAFLDNTMADAAHPQDWPYPERVLGFAAHPIELPESPGVLVPAFRAAVWNGGSIQGPVNRTRVKPPVNLFCDTTNNCVPGGQYVPTDPDVVGEPAGPCANRNTAGKFDLRCWYHRPVTWKTDCAQTCGYELLRFDPGYAYQADGTAYPPRCDTTGLPAGTVIIDDIPASAPIVRPGCARSWTNGGTFSFTFGANAQGEFPSKVDTHQFGAGFGGHLYSSFGRGPGYSTDVWPDQARMAATESEEARMRVTGTWRATQPIHGWTRVKVSLPDTGATEQLARYDIDLGNGQTRFRVVPQRSTTNTWWDLGVFRFDGIPSVSLSTYTLDGYGENTIAWDAVALVPATQPSANYVAMGDSYSSGEGAAPYRPDSDRPGDNTNPYSNTCHRSQNDAYPMKVKLPGHTTTIAQEAAAGTASFAFIACSGAMTTNITTAAYNTEPQPDDTAGHTDWKEPYDWTGGYPYLFNNELPQVDQGYLDADTTLVTLTIGGNDARFAEVLRSCIASLDSCFSSTHHLTRDNHVVDPDYLQRYEKKVIRELLPKHLLATYRAVVSRAPNAKVLVLGYPQLFNDRFQAPTDCAGLATSEMLGLNTFADLLNLQIARTVQQVHDEGHDISFVNTTQRWRDTHSHWACEFWTDPWVRGGIVSCQSNVGTQTPCPASFHPTVTGQAALADIVNTQLRGVSPVAAIKQRVLDYAATRAPDPRWSLTAAQAGAIAQRCLDLTRIGGTIGDPCMHEPIFVVSSADSGDAAVNDDMALAEKLPWWVRLNYTRSDTREEYIAPRDWYNNRPFKPNFCADNPRPANAECDEFPYFSSELGAAFDPYDGYYAEGSTRLRWVDKVPNGIEGNMLGIMYSQCGIPSSTYGYDSTLLDLGGPYLVIPVTTGTPPNTHFIC